VIKEHNHHIDNLTLEQLIKEKKKIQTEHKTKEEIAHEVRGK
jgi:hypothetical protein